MWIQKYIELSMSDIPRSLAIELKKERYLIKEKLKLNLSESQSEVIVDMIQHELKI
jgi:hypothetical protein